MEEHSAESRPWWYKLFSRRLRVYDGTSWEPPFWERLCPYPFCPSYRQFARALALLFTVLLIWGIIYCLLGNTAAPGGQLFGLAIVCIAAQFGGWLISLIDIPALIGMLMTGILFQNVGLVHIEGGYVEIVSVLRKVALVIILTRAGLDMDSGALKRHWLTISKLGLIPWAIETLVIAIMTHYLLKLPWIWGFLVGAIIAAISPAVVVPGLLRLGRKGYGVAKGIPTLIIAVSVIDDAISVAVFGILHSVIFTSERLLFQILQGPLSIIGGIVYGILWGLISKFVPEKGDPFLVPLRTFMLFGGGLIAVLGSESFGCGGAGPLGVITAAFVSCYFWIKQGWDIDDNPVAAAFQLFWKFFEPILFGLTGTQVKINELDSNSVSIAVGCLVAGALVRFLITVVIAFGSNLNCKEKLFIAMSWMAKATVQAALGPMALDSVRNEKIPKEEEKKYAESVVTICILSIILTAPIGAILITLNGPRLLTKTTVPTKVKKRRKSIRPTLRHISIMDDEEKDEEGEQENVGEGEDQENVGGEKEVGEGSKM